VRRSRAVKLAGVLETGPTCQSTCQRLSGGSNPPNQLHRRDRLGGLIHEYARAHDGRIYAPHAPRAASPPPNAVRAQRLGLQPEQTLCTPHRTRRSVPAAGYFPRAVFFFGFGFLVLPVLPGAAAFFGRFGDTGSLLAWLAVLQRLRVRIRSEAPSRPAGRAARRYRSASPRCQSTEPSRPSPETAIVNGCCKRARPAKVARRCVPVSLSRATAASRPSQQTTRQERGSASADQATPS
jgi:hypothetical protein